MNKNDINARKALLSILVVLMVLPASGLSQVDESTLLTALKEMDSLQMAVPSGSRQPLVSGFSATINLVKGNVFDPEQGAEFVDINVEWSKDWCVLKCVSNYEHDPVYKPPRQEHGASHDSSGNYIVNRCLERYFFSSTDQSDILERLISFRINSEGEILSETTSSRLLRFPPKSSEGLFIFGQFRMATGRSFGEKLTAVTRVMTENLPPDQVAVEASGNDGGSLTGKWILKLEPRADYLVREARFYREGENEPTTVVTNTGLVECLGLKVAKQGVYRAGNYEARFEVSELNALGEAQVSQNSLYREVLSAVTSTYPDMTIGLDLRGKDPRAITNEKKNEE